MYKKNALLTLIISVLCIAPIQSADQAGTGQSICCLNVVNDTAGKWRIIRTHKYFKEASKGTIKKKHFYRVADQIPGALHIESKTNQKTFLHAAAQGGIMELVGELCCYIHPNKTDVHGQTPLHYAAKGGHIEIADYLIEKGISPFSVDNDRKTVFHHAAENGQIGFISRYLEKYPCADYYKIRDKSGKNVVQSLQGKSSAKTIIRNAIQHCLRDQAKSNEGQLECGICFEDDTTFTVSCFQCLGAICTTCKKELSVCPYCRCPIAHNTDTMQGSEINAKLKESTTEHHGAGALPDYPTRTEKTEE